MRHAEIDALYQVERRKDELEAAARARLLYEVANAGRPIARRQNRVSIRKVARGLLLALAQGLSFLGGHLVTWGCRLQTRYESLAGAAPESQPSPCG